MRKGYNANKNGQKMTSENEIQILKIFVKTAEIPLPE